MANDRITGYASAVLSIADTEDDPARLVEQVMQAAAALDSSSELKATLADSEITLARRQQIVEDLLGGQVSPVATSIVSMIVGAGLTGSLGQIATRISEIGATSRGASFALVRSAIPLDDDQQARLALALTKSTGKPVELQVVVDPSVMGGLITQIDDEIIDGSVRSRLGQLRKAF
ncbi:MAG: F-type H+-transporting ATPase subunit delta [Acidimicrobiales bacterium]|jgi:F-type H+-transporting ATPase subunit delta